MRGGALPPEFIQLDPVNGGKYSTNVSINILRTLPEVLIFNDCLRWEKRKWPSHVHWSIAYWIPLRCKVATAH